MNKQGGRMKVFKKPRIQQPIVDEKLDVQMALTYDIKEDVTTLLSKYPEDAKLKMNLIPIQQSLILQFQLIERLQNEKMEEIQQQLNETIKTTFGDQFHCNVCFNYFTKANIYTTPSCQQPHPVCYGCLRKIEKVNSATFTVCFVCPICRSMTHTHNFQHLIESENDATSEEDW